MLLRMLDAHLVWLLLFHRIKKVEFSILGTTGTLDNEEAKRVANNSLGDKTCAQRRQLCF